MTQIQQDKDMVCFKLTNILFVTCVWTICRKRAKWSKNFKRSSNSTGVLLYTRNLTIYTQPQQKINKHEHVPQRGKSLYQRGTFGCSILSMELILDRFIASITSRWCCSPQSKAKKFPHFLQWWEIRIIPTVFCWEKFFCSHVFAQNPAFAGTWYVQNLWTPYERMGSTAFFLSYCRIGVATINSGFFYLEQAESDESQVYYPWESPVSNWTFKSVETFWRFTKGSGSNPFYICCENGCFLKWWYLQNTPKWSFLVGKTYGCWVPPF